MQASGASAMQVEATAALRNIRVRDLMTQDCEQVSGGIDLQTFVNDYMLRTGRRCFIVMQDGHLAGLITPHEVKQVERSQWPLTSVAQVMRRVESIHSVSPDTPASEALDIMGREDVNQVPVLSNGWFHGIVSRGHILQVLQTAADLNRGKAA
jgi:predicted transcriptional regulator